MSEPLAIYLADHLGGAQIAKELLAAMREQHEASRFREFASELLREIETDDRTLQSIADKIGTGSATVKRAGGWLVEKTARLKLGHTGSTDLGMFESLELLALGIHGKLCLWRALDVISRTDARLHGYDFQQLIQRAIEQHQAVDVRRLDIARTALLPTE